MASQFDPAILIARVAGAAPFLLVALVGVVLCLVRESRPVRVRVAAGCAIALVIGLRMALPLLFTHVLSLLPPGGGGSGLDYRFLLYSLVSSVGQAVALGLLLWGAFARDDRPPEPSDVVA